MSAAGVTIMDRAKASTDSVVQANSQNPRVSRGACRGSASLLVTCLLVSACSGSDSPGTLPSAGGMLGTGGNSQDPGTSSIGGKSSSGTGVPAGGSGGRDGTDSLVGGGTLGTAVSIGGSSQTGSSATRPSGGQSNSGGTASAGAATSSGGATLTGGAAGSAAVGGSQPVAGSKATGGLRTTGGTKNAGGAGVLGGSRATGGESSNGGAGTMGGAGTTGGATAIGGTASTGGSSSADRCDVGVYDAANPPRALTLSGNLEAHDPAVIFQENNGTYYEFQTGLRAKTSTNLSNWSGAPVPFTAPAWIQTAVPGVTDLWAPDISYFNGKYHLYYSGSTFGKNRSCIGYATRASLSSGSWADQGSVICSNVGTNDNWNAIDPNVILDTDGKPWLAFGSFWSGIKMIRLDDNGARAGTEAPISIADRPKNGGAVEGPFIVRRCGYYYLFTSWDTCCKGVDSTYNMRVARSTSVTGPYTDKAGTAATAGGGTLIAQGNGTWAGPGGQSVMIVGNKAHLVYHAYSVANNGNATLRIADLVWDSSGWPVPVGP